MTIGSDPMITDTELSGHGRLLRLIVVGINSFKSGSAAANNPGAPNHVVFQFQNIPVTHKMETTNINTNGYVGSAMKTYIMGDFLTGLKAAAGLTTDMLWRPTRKVSHGGSPQTATDTITDTLWLPTEWEMFGSRSYSSQSHEVDAGQAQLDYYTGAPIRVKYHSSNAAIQYWIASPFPTDAVAFCYVNQAGTGGAKPASDVYGVAPAFCVK